MEQKKDEQKKKVATTKVASTKKVTATKKATTAKKQVAKKTTATPKTKTVAKKVSAKPTVKPTTKPTTKKEVVIAKEVTKNKVEAPKKATITKKNVEIKEPIVEVKKEVIVPKKEVEKVDNIKKVEREITNRDVMFIILIVSIGVFVIALLSNVARNNMITNKEKLNDNTQKEQIVKYSFINERGKEQNNSKALNEIKTYNGLNLTNVKLVKSSKNCIYSAIFENKTDKIHLGEIVNIVFVDRNLNELERVKIFIKELAPGENIEVICSTDTDVINAYDYKIKD